MELLEWIRKLTHIRVYEQVYSIDEHVCEIFIYDGTVHPASQRDGLHAIYSKSGELIRIHCNNNLSEDVGRVIVELYYRTIYPYGFENAEGRF